jgi:hypothetical protein
MIEIKKQPAFSYEIEVFLPIAGAAGRAWPHERLLRCLRQKMERRFAILDARGAPPAALRSERVQRIPCFGDAMWVPA